VATRDEIQAKEVCQKVSDIYELEDLDLDPKNTHQLFLGGVVNRVMAWLCGWADKKLTRLQCTSGGILKVATTGVGFEHNDTWADTAANAYGTAKTFDLVASRVDVFLFDNAAYIKRSKDGVTYDDEIELPGGCVYSYDGTTAAINIRNKTADSDARFSIVGWY
jgi:hypothetical protein